jgi:hypothetical protein
MYVEDAPKHALTVWIFNKTNFCMPFSLSKNGLCMWISAYPLVENNFFSQCSTPLVGIRFCRHKSNPPRDKNKMLHNHAYLKKLFLGLQNFTVPLWHSGNVFFVNFKCYDLANGKE